MRLTLSHWLGAIVLLFGCKPETHDARERLCAGSGCSQACRDLRIEPCDIRDKECQDVIFQSLQCVRGQVLEATPKLRITESLLAGDRSQPEQVPMPDATMSPMASAMNMGSTASAPSTTAPEGTQTATPASVSTQELEARAREVYSYYVDEGLKLLHFIPEPTTIDCVIKEEEGMVGGLQTGGEVFIEESNVGHRWLSMQLVAHEFVHAQQEADYGGIAELYTRYPNSTKSRQSIRALIEGEADLYALLTHAFMRNTETDDWALPNYFEERSRTLLRAIADQDTPWTHADWWLHYSVGAAVLAARWESGRNLAVRAVHHNLEPDFGAWVRNLVPLRGADLGSEATCVPSRRQMIVRDQLGPSGVYALMMAASKGRLIKPVEPAWQVARSLVDDKLDFFAPLLPEGDTQTEWFAEAYEECKRAQALEPDAGAGDAGLGDAATNASSGGSGTDPKSCAAEKPPVPTCVEPGAPTSGNTVDEATIPNARLLPQGSAWVSWRLAFDTESDAKEFVEYVSHPNWPTLEISRHDAQVLLKGYRQGTSAAERAAFDAWEPLVTCAD